MGTNTGNNGFDIDGKTYTFDVGDPDAPGEPPVNADSGDVSVDNSKKDLSKGTKETLSRYLSNLTRNNRYSLDAQAEELKLTTDKGLPAPVVETNNTERFTAKAALQQPYDVPQDLRKGERLFDKISDPVGNLGINKGKAFPPADNGNDVLPGIKGGDPTKPGTLPSSISGYVSTVLSNNRFTATAQAVVSDPIRPGNDYNPTMIHPKYGEISAARLAQVGTALSLRSSQELGASDDGNNPSGGGQEARSLLPGFNQLGAARINTSILEARDVLETLTEDSISEGNTTSIAPGGSWGSMNNVQDPYSGITAVGMIALAAALTAAIVVLFEGLGFLLSLVKGGDKTGPAKNFDGRYALGRYNLVQGPDPNAFPPTSFPPDIGALLGIRPTIHPFASAMTTGVNTFFGIDTSGGLLGRVTSGLQSSAEAPGFNAIVARSIIRSTLTVIDSFKDAFKSPNLVAGVKNVLSIVDAIRGSKLIASLNVFANLGDNVLTANELDEVVPGLPGEPKRVSRIDKLEDTAPAVQKNRLRGSLKLAWASNRSPSSYLIPEPVLTLASVGGKLGAPNIIGTQSPLAKNYFKIMNLTEQVKTALRLPYDSSDPREITVKSIEGKLDAEYMPFYMHDLRTNEIISFHAFITQLTDDFSANWEQSDGYGRVDPVKVYKSTTRRINIGFVIASTSDEDFDDMWVKINKLITLVYPQYTAGRVLSDATGTNQFTQPFSQLIGASPLIRLRLGDLFKSNYSRFALARLFGADSNNMKLDGEIKFEGATDIIKALQDDIKSPVGKTYTLSSNNLSKPSETSMSVSLPSVPGTQRGNTPSVALTFNVPAGDVHYFVFKVKSVMFSGASTSNAGDRAVIVPELMNNKLLQDFYGLSADAATATLKYLKAEYDNKDKPAKRVVGGEYVANLTDLRIAPDRFESIVNKGLSTATANVDKLAEFLSSDKNAIVKSFKEVQGKGLAGTIDSLNFDFFNNVTWEIAPNRRAPQFCRVTLAFSPIHDISPGLDHLGYNRGPVFPVGHLAHGPDRDKSGG